MERRIMTRMIEVEDFVYDEFESIRKELGVYGTHPPGIPFGYDHTATLQRIMSGYKMSIKIKLTV